MRALTPNFFKTGAAAFPGAAAFRITEGAGAAALVSAGRRADTIIFCLSDASELRLLRSLEPLKKKVVVLSVLNPALLENLRWISGALAIYSYAPESFAAGFSAIRGKIPAGGKLPYD